MTGGVRRALAGAVVGGVLVFGVAPGTIAVAETPTPSATATVAATPASGGSNADTPDVAPDNSRQALALGAAGALAVLAGLAVFLRRH